MNARTRQIGCRMATAAQAINQSYQRIASVAIVAVLLGCSESQPTVAPATIAPKEQPTAAMLAVKTPPFVITRELTADWDKPQVFEAPDLRIQISVSAPVLEPIANAADIAANDLIDMPYTADQPSAVIGARGTTARSALPKHLRARRKTDSNPLDRR